jgi:hypothetical protein
MDSKVGVTDDVASHLEIDLCEEIEAVVESCFVIEVRNEDVGNSLVLSLHLPQRYIVKLKKFL